MWLSNLPFKNIGASNLSRFSQDGVFGFGRSPPISGGPSLPGRWRLCSDLPRAPVAAMGRLEDEILEPWEMCLFHSLKKKVRRKV